MSDSPLLAAARRWVIDRYPYNSRHLLQSLAWLDRLAPASVEAVRLATLTHDMERAFPGPDQPVAAGFNDPEYLAAHSARSARIVGAWLREQGAASGLTAQVEALIGVHEVGGWPEANLVQAADSLSFLETNVELFVGMVLAGRRPFAEVEAKFDHCYHRIQEPQAREWALPLWQAAKARLGDCCAAPVPLIRSFNQERL